MFSAKHGEEKVERVEQTKALRVWGQLNRISQKIARAGTERLRPHGLTPAQFGMLRRIAQKPDQTQQDLVEQAGVTRGNVSQLLAKLEGDGLVVRVPHANSNLLRLTPTGRQRLEQLLPDHDAFITEQFAGLSVDEHDQLLNLLGRVERTLP